MLTRRAIAIVLTAFAAPIVAACGGSSSYTDPDPPVGKPVLADLVPKAPLNLQTRLENGRWHVAFTTVIVNAGPGDFILRGKRDGSTWSVEQGIEYSTSGAAVVRVKSPLAWGGDGHDHWHIARVASVRLVGLDAEGRPVDEEGRLDSKVGFCFYDHTHELERGPGERLYSAYSCGHRDDEIVGMGLSPGWNDTYRSSLPGQSVDVTGLPDGTYRMWFEVDENGWFREKTRANNRTWIDFELSTMKDTRVALATGKGPEPS